MLSQMFSKLKKIFVITVTSCLLLMTFSPMFTTGGVVNTTLRDLDANLGLIKSTPGSSSIFSRMLSGTVETKAFLGFGDIVFDPSNWAEAVSQLVTQNAQLLQMNIERMLQALLRNIVMAFIKAILNFFVSQFTSLLNQITQWANTAFGLQLNMCFINKFLATQAYNIYNKTVDSIASVVNRAFPLTSGTTPQLLKDQYGVRTALTDAATALELKQSAIAVRDTYANCGGSNSTVTSYTKNVINEAEQIQSKKQQNIDNLKIKEETLKIDSLTKKSELDLFVKETNVDKNNDYTTTTLRVNDRWVAAKAVYQTVQDDRNSGWCKDYLNSSAPLNFKAPAGFTPPAGIIDVDAYYYNEEYNKCKIKNNNATNELAASKAAYVDSGIKDTFDKYNDAAIIAEAAVTNAGTDVTNAEADTTLPIINNFVTACNAYLKDNTKPLPADTTSSTTSSTYLLKCTDTSTTSTLTNQTNGIPSIDPNIKISTSQEDLQNFANLSNQFSAANIKLGLDNTNVSFNNSDIPPDVANLFLNTANFIKANDPYTQTLVEAVGNRAIDIGDSAKKKVDDQQALNPKDCSGASYAVASDEGMKLGTLSTDVSSITNLQLANASIGIQTGSYINPFSNYIDSFTGGTSTVTFNSEAKITPAGIDLARSAGIDATNALANSISIKPLNGNECGTANGLFTTSKDAIKSAQDQTKSSSGNETSLMDDVMNAVIAAATAFFDTIKNMIMNIFNQIANTMLKKLNTLGDGIFTSSFQTFFSDTSTLLSNQLDFVKDITLNCQKVKTC